MIYDTSRWLQLWGRRGTLMISYVYQKPVARLGFLARIIPYIPNIKISSAGREESQRTSCWLPKKETLVPELSRLHRFLLYNDEKYAGLAKCQKKKQIEIETHFSSPGPWYMLHAKMKRNERRSCFQIAQIWYEEVEGFHRRGRSFPRGANRMYSANCWEVLSTRDCEPVQAPIRWSAKVTTRRPEDHSEKI